MNILASIGQFWAKITSPVRPPIKLTQDVWFMVLVLGTAFLASRYDFQLSTLALPQFKESFSASDDQITALTIASKLGSIPAVLAAFAADRIGRRPLFLYSIIGFSISAMVAAFAPNVYVLMGALFFTRLFTMIDELLALVMLAEGAPPKARAWALGALGAIGSFGDASAIILYGNLAEAHDGWRWLYGIGALPILATIWWRVQLKENSVFLESQKDQSQNTFSVLALDWKKVGLILLASFAYWVPISPALSFVSLHLQADNGWQPAEVSILTMSAGILGLLGNIMGGRVADLYGRRATSIGATILTLLGMIGVYQAADSGLIGISYAFALMGWFTSLVAMRALFTESIDTKARATLMGLAEIAATTGVVTGIYFFGIAARHHVGAPNALLMTAPVAIITLIVIWTLQETKGRALEKI